MANFVRNLKPGDTVIVSGGWGQLETCEKVDRLTKTRVIVESGRVFRRDNGYRVGVKRWDTLYLKEATKERVEKLHRDTERKRLARRLTDCNWYNMSLDDLRKVIEALPRPEQQKNS